MIKNAIIYRVTPGYRFDPEILGRHPARPCGALEQRTAGFTEPCKHSTNGLVHSVSGYQVICFESETKLLPGSVVSDAVAERIEKIEGDQVRKVGRKEARDIKERVIDEFLPKAFVQHQRTLAVLTSKYFIVNTSSTARADDLLSCLGTALNHQVPLQPLNTIISPMSAMTGWVADGDAPDVFTIDDTLELRSANEVQAAIRYIHHDLGGPEVAKHIAGGKIAVKLGMTWNDRVSFVLDTHLQLKRIALLDIVTAEAEEPEDAMEVFDADLTLSVGEVTQVIDWLVSALGGVVKPEADLIEGKE